MKIAIPVANGKLSMHFGHCEKFILMEVDEKEKKILSKKELPAPPHEPGLLPRFLHEAGAEVIISGGMGQRAKSLFEEKGIHVVVGASALEPEEIAIAYLNGSLETGENCCDH
ncbi:MAG TPA: ATPase [Firmicutes bacterium]|nr:ATPase [Bacillota bacterium]